MSAEAGGTGNASRANGAPDSANSGAHGSAWERAHHALSRLARRRAALDAEEGRCLLTALRASAHVHLGFGTFCEYVERVLGYSPRSTREKLRVAEALEGLPALSCALDAGVLSWSALRELTRVANADTEAKWLEFSEGKTVRQLEDVVAHAKPGDGPDSPRAPGPCRHVLRLEVTPETFALFREASAYLRRHGDRAFDDDALLLAMARAVLGGPTDDGRASYQVSLSICSECGRAEQRANGALIEIGPEIVAMADCDAQHVGSIGDTDGAAEPANDGPSVADADGPDLIRPKAPADARGSADPLLCGDSSGSNHHARPSLRAAAPDIDARRAAPAVRARVGQRARQSIPPAVRRAVLNRDHHRCCVPGCKNAMFLDLHHVQPRSEGGSNDPANLISVCGAHHRALHRNQLIVEHEAKGFRFGHADGRPYGDVGAPTPGIDSPSIERKVASALRHLGFRNPDVQAVLSELRQENTTAGGAPRKTTESLLREALVRLGPQRSARR